MTQRIQLLAPLVALLTLPHPAASQDPEVWRLGSRLAAFGHLDDPSGTIFERIDAATFLSSSRFAVGDAEIVRVFDVGNVISWSAGRSGEGPGEFKGISWMQPRGDSLVVFDGSLNRLTVFDPGGEFVRTEAIRASGIDGRPLPIGLFGNGAIVTKQGDRGLRMSPDTPQGYTRASRKSSYFQVSDGQASVLTTLDDSPGYALRVGNQIEVGPEPLAASAVHAINGEFLVVAHGASGRLEVFYRDGARRELDSGLTAAELSPRDWEQFRDRYVAGTSGPELRARETILDSMDRPTDLPAINDVHIDAHDLIWLQRFTLDPSRSSWLIIDLTGAQIAEIEFPGTLELLDIGAEALLVRARDEFDVPRIEVWAFDRGR